MLRHDFILGKEVFRGLTKCYTQVVHSPVGKDETILAVDLLSYTVRTNVEGTGEVS